MSQWPSTKARQVLAALLRRGRSIKREVRGSHRVLSPPGWPTTRSRFETQTRSAHGCWRASLSAQAGCRTTSSRPAGLDNAPGVDACRIYAAPCDSAEVLFQTRATAPASCTPSGPPHRTRCTSTRTTMWPCRTTGTSSAWPGRRTNGRGRRRGSAPSCRRSRRGGADVSEGS